MNAVSDRRVRTAAVGLGWVTTHRHIPTMRALGEYELVGVIDRQRGRAEEYARSNAVANWAETGDLSEVDWLDRVDAVTIGVAPFGHYDLAMQALGLGKHVLTEKPFAMTVAEGEEMVRTARENGLIIGVVHNFQFATSTRALLGDMESGRLGAIRSIAAYQLSNPRRRLPSWYEDLPLGLFYDESPHFFYLLSRLSPGPLTLDARTIHPSTYGQVTPALITAKYSAETGEIHIPVTFSMNFEAALSEWHILVHGDEMLGAIDVFRDIYVRLPNDGLHVTNTVFRTTRLATWQHWAQHLRSGIRHLTGRLRYGNETVFARFAESVRTGEEPEGIGADNALRVLRMQHEIIEGVPADAAE